MEGVVNPRFFDNECRVLSGLKALQELLLFEKGFVLAEEHIPSSEDGVITPKAIGSLVAALRKLGRFAVMGGLLDLGRPDWAGSWVTPEGLIVVQGMPWTRELVDRHER